MLRGAVGWCVLELMRMYSVDVGVGVGGVWKEWTGLALLCGCLRGMTFFG